MGSIVIIWFLTIILVYEATVRIVNKMKVDDPLIMLITAAFGLFCNLVMAKMLHGGPAHDRNLMHSCGHDHGPGGHDHGHDHGGHDHGHSHAKPERKDTRGVSL